MGSDISDFGGGFVAVVVEMEVSDLELEVGDVVRIIWCCMNKGLYFLCRLSRKSLDGECVKCWWVFIWCTDAGKFFDGGLLF